MVGIGIQLLLGPVALFVDLGRWGIALPLAVWMLFWLMTRQRLNRSQPPFVAAHWRLALRRYTIMAIGYGITVALLLLSYLIEASVTGHSPQQLLAVALIRIGVMPAIIALFVSLVVGNGGLSQANQGLWPKGLAPEDGAIESD